MEEIGSFDTVKQLDASYVGVGETGSTTVAIVLVGRGDFVGVVISAAGDQLQATRQSKVILTHRNFFAIEVFTFEIRWYSPTLLLNS